MDAGTDERGRQVRAGLLSVVALAATLVSVAPAGAQPTGRLLVLLDRPPAPRAQAAAVRALAARAGALPAGRGVPELGLVVVRPGRGRSSAAVARALRGQPEVRSVQPEGRMALRFVPDDTALGAPETAPGTPPGTPLQWPPQRTGLFGAWDLARGAGALVGVIDTGLDAGHPDFAGKVAAAVDQDDDPSTGPATVDESGHGSHVSSLACAATGNRVGIAGAGFDCRLVMEKTDLTDSSIARSIVDAADRGALAVNMSFGDSGSRPPVAAIDSAIDYAVARQVVLVAAARDERTDTLGQPVPDQGQPANLLQPAGSGGSLDAGRGLAVTSSTIDDHPSGAGAGSEISLAAPGSMFEFGSRAGGPPGLLGVAPAGHADLLDGPLAVTSNTCACRTSLDGATYAYLEGTSMSAPQVAAIAALMRALNPDLRALEVVRLLKETARRAPGSGWSPELGWGIVDAATALEAASRIDRRPPTSRLRAPTRTRARALWLRWSARDGAPAGVRASGVAYVEVWRALDRHRARRIARTRRSSLRVRVAPVHRYSFFTVAVDRAGNREASPGRPDAVTRVRR
jgi:subtilisin family serine protease